MLLRTKQRPFPLQKVQQPESSSISLVVHLLAYSLFCSSVHSSNYEALRMCLLSSATGNIILNYIWKCENLHPHRLLVKLGQRHVCTARNHDNVLWVPSGKIVYFLEERTVELCLAGREAVSSENKGSMFQAEGSGKEP